MNRISRIRKKIDSFSLAGAGLNLFRFKIPNMKYLESKEGIAGGELVIIGTRIRIAQFLQFLKAGHSLEQIYNINGIPGYR